MNYHPDLISTTIKMIAALSLILGVLLILFYSSKRLLNKGIRGGEKNLIKILANNYIGVKKSISLVEVPGSVLVLGVTNDSITLLSKIEDKKIIDKITVFEGEKISPSFSDHLHDLSSKLRNRKNDIHLQEENL